MEAKAKLNNVDEIIQAITDLSLGTRALVIINELYQTHRISHDEYCSFKDRIFGYTTQRKDTGRLIHMFKMPSALTPEGEAVGRAGAGHPTTDELMCKICKERPAVTKQGLCKHCDLEQAAYGQG